MSGMPTIIPKLSRSRESCRSSLSVTARIRPNIASRLRRRRPRIAPETRRGDEHVLEARVHDRDLRIDAGRFEAPTHARRRIRRLWIEQRVQPACRAARCS